MNALEMQLYEALKYARRFLKDEDHDTAYVDAAIDRAEDRLRAAALPKEDAVAVECKRLWDCGDKIGAIKHARYELGVDLITARDFAHRIAGVAP